MEEPPKKAIHPSLPPNYVSILDLRERWLQKQNQNKRHEEHESIPLNVAAGGKDELACDGNNEKSALVSSNPNPNSANRVSSSHGGDRCRWVQARQPKEAPLEKKLVPNDKGDNKDGGIQSLGGNVDDGKVDGVKKKEYKCGNGRNEKKKKGGLDMNGGEDKGFEVGSGNVNVGDDRRGGIEGKFAGFSSSRGEGERSGDRLISVRNRPGRIRGGGGGIGGRGVSERGNQKNEDVVQLQLEGGVSDRNGEGEGEKIAGSGFGVGNKNVRGEWGNRRNHKKGVVESQSGKGVLDPNDDGVGKRIPEQRFEGGREDKNVNDNARGYHKKKDVVQLPPDGGALDPSDGGKDKKISEIGFEDASGNKKAKNRRNHKKKDVVKLLLDGGALGQNNDGNDKKVPELGWEDGSGNKNVDDNVTDEIKGKFGGLSLSGGKGQSSGGRSIAVRIRQGQGRIKGGHGKFERPNDDGGDKKIPEQGFEFESVTKNVDDDTRAEIEGKLAGVPLSRGTRESSGGRSVGVQNLCGGIRGGRGGRSIVTSDQCRWIRGGHDKSEDGVMYERTRRGCVSSLVWVKKEEASEIGAVSMEEAGNK